MGSSYKRYREYQANRHQYKMEQVVAPVMMMLVIGFLTKYGWIIAVSIVVLVAIKLWNKISDSSAKSVVTDEDEKLITEKEEMPIMKTTETGYINKNNQRNNGRTDKAGTDFGQWYYAMECLNENCGHKYYANGTDIWQRKCPKCQGGRP